MADNKSNNNTSTYINNYYDNPENTFESLNDLIINSKYNNENIKENIINNKNNINLNKKYFNEYSYYYNDNKD